MSNQKIDCSSFCQLSFVIQCVNCCTTGTYFLQPNNAAPEQIHQHLRHLHASNHLLTLRCCRKKLIELRSVCTCWDLRAFIFNDESERLENSILEKICAKCILLSVRHHCEQDGWHKRLNGTLIDDRGA
mmetsp:Transcript_7196/g.13653  ORF Transcript_7196/g.13653 Transcript_7196/m.13653 type:complete len:129 (-) Transcript_7196:93-479(-)